jgi:hypothetical protein
MLKYSLGKSITDTHLSNSTSNITHTHMNEAVNSSHFLFPPSDAIGRRLRHLDDKRAARHVFTAPADVQHVVAFLFGLVGNLVGGF